MHRPLYPFALGMSSRRVGALRPLVSFRGRFRLRSALVHCLARPGVVRRRRPLLTLAWVGSGTWD